MAGYLVKAMKLVDVMIIFLFSTFTLKDIVL